MEKYNDPIQADDFADVAGRSVVQQTIEITPVPYSGNESPIQINKQPVNEFMTSIPA